MSVISKQVRVIQKLQKRGRLKSVIFMKRSAICARILEKCYFRNSRHTVSDGAATSADRGATAPRVGFTMAALPQANGNDI